MASTAAETAADVRASRTTAEAETRAALERIAQTDPGIGAFQVVRGEQALAEARAVDSRPDRFALPLAGVPVAVKDNVPVEGEPMRNGSLATSPEPQLRSHVVVDRLRRAGGVVVGITRVPELCVFGTTDSPFGVTRNPLDVRRSPGGSSGGSAAAVAAGMVTVAHGNDGMGSLRIPAACTGLVGFKPGRGVVPWGDDASWFGLSEHGPLATTVDDAALLLSVLAADPALAVPLDPGPLRVATSTVAPVPLTPVHASYVRAVETAAAALRDAGHRVEQADPPAPVTTAVDALARWLVGTAESTEPLPHPDRLVRRTRVHAALGRVAGRAGFPHAAAQQRWVETAERWFGAGHDVLVTPALAGPPKHVASRSGRPWSDRGWLANVVSDARYAPFAAPWNLAGWPAIAVPVPSAADRSARIPPSVQLVGPPGSERTLLAAARLVTGEGSPAQPV
ncbi:amidase [Jatrophihabitans sp. YIM 134969]